jgi:diacylglycerol O-acyltransferase
MQSVSMGVQDQLWLTMDRPNNLMVVDGAMVLEGIPDHDEVVGTYQDLVDRFPVFGRSAHRAGNGWVWRDHPGFRVVDHLERVEVPTGAGQEFVQDFLADKRTEPLDRDRPLWQAYFLSPVELPDGTVGSAVVSRFHHAIADGVRLTQVMLGMCEGGATIAAKVTRSRPTDDLPSVAERARAMVSGTAQAVAQGVEDLTAEAAQAARHPLRSLAHLPWRVVDLGRQGVEDGVNILRRPDRLLDALETFGVENLRGANDLGSLTKITFTGTPATVWTGRPGTTKAVTWSEPIPLDDIKATGRALGATVNDVLLAAIAGSLRRYLADHGGPVDEVNWMVPVNLKPFEDDLPEDLGNYFALVILPMALDGASPRERLQQMHHRMNRIKHSDEAVITFGVQRVMAVSPAQVAFFLTNFFANKAVGVLTNVPGPTEPMTFAGVRVRQVVGFAPCSGDQPMTATIFSYNGGVTIGFATDAELIPDPDSLAEGVQAELAELRTEAGI